MWCGVVCCGVVCCGVVWCGVQREGEGESVFLSVNSFFKQCLN